MSILTRATTEDELLTAITDAATYMGYRWHHVRRSDKAIQQGHSGFPDLVLTRAGRCYFLELKRQDGTVSPDQKAWLDELGAREDVVAMVVRPSDLDDVLWLLR